MFDINLLQAESVVTAHHCEMLGDLAVDCGAGGVWYLEQLLRPLLKGSEVNLLSPKKPELHGSAIPDGLPRAYQLWKRFPKTRQEEGQKESIWRVETLMGCEAVVPEKRLAADFGPDDTLDPALLVIDDLNLGFRSVPSDHLRRLWPKTLCEGGKPKHVVVKTSEAADDSPLWRFLLDPGTAPNVTVVMSACTLRDRGAAMTKSLSWDRTIEELDAELLTGESARHLGQFGRVVVQFEDEGVAVYEQKDDSLKFVGFLYDPQHHEGAWRRSFPGTMFGNLSILTAALVRHIVRPADYPLSIALARAVAAGRRNRELAGGSGPKLNLRETSQQIQKKLMPAIEEMKAAGYSEPLSQFATAFPPLPKLLFGFRSRAILADHTGARSDLLRDLVGYSKDPVMSDYDFELLVAKGVEIVLRGAEKALTTAPRAHYGKYFTVDRTEIERLHAIRNLILNYSGSKQKRPLSIAVFGPPGSGKSFAIKELMSTIEQAHKEDCLTFNLAEFKDEADLHNAFQQVRDLSLRGRIPLVFWDEFDSEKMRWIKHFLVPMQDAEFVVQGHAHPFARAIFVFAGGTCSSFDKFAQQQEAYREQKLPDFVSRLRGHLDMKGPNPSGWEPGKNDMAARRAADPAYVLRRAIILRVSLSEYCPELVKRGAVSTAIINGFLRAEYFKHGARSMDAIISMSQFHGAPRFEASMLPPEDLLHLHVSEDFLQRVREAQLR
ncbi:MAG: hypothetical protein ACLP3R_10025, partial [Candidatus Korobacteraceae bacterium]